MIKKLMLVTGVIGVLYIAKEYDPWSLNYLTIETMLFGYLFWVTGMINTEKSNLKKRNIKRV